VVKNQNGGIWNVAGEYSVEIFGRKARFEVFFRHNRKNSGRSAAFCHLENYRVCHFDRKSVNLIIWIFRKCFNYRIYRDGCKFRAKLTRKRRANKLFSAFSPISVKKAKLNKNRN
jgi:hypothetical protein